MPSLTRCGLFGELNGGYYTVKVDGTIDVASLVGTIFVAVDAQEL